LDHLTLTTPGGRPAPLTSVAGKKATVLVFLSFECPMSNSYLADLGALARRHGGPDGGDYHPQGGVDGRRGEAEGPGEREADPGRALHRGAGQEPAGRRGEQAAGDLGHSAEGLPVLALRLGGAHQRGDGPVGREEEGPDLDEHLRGRGERD